MDSENTQKSKKGAICLTVDVEEWFHVPGHPYCGGRGPGEPAGDRLAVSLRKTLDFLNDLQIRSTFFVLGLEAERYPDLVRSIIDGGHEVACHGFEHELVFEMGPDAFREDVRRSRDILESITGRAPEGYRAPRWSLNGAAWAYPILEELGFAYSSSRLPIPGMGWDSPKPRMMGEILEVPVLTLPWKSMPVPAGGTLALRILPMDWLEAARDEAASDGVAAVYWMHPWELDPEAPRLTGMGGAARFQRYGYLSRLPHRLSGLLPPSRSCPLGEAVRNWLSCNPHVE